MHKKLAFKPKFENSPCRDCHIFHRPPLKWTALLLATAPSVEDYIVRLDV
jgi:hypothetical protein